MSREELGEEFVRQKKAGQFTDALRREFVRRYWLEQEQRALAGQPLRLYPFDR